MEVNGHNSCTGNSRHVDIRYFFVHDCVKTSTIQILYCPTERMLADFFTKLLQGGAFKKFRDAVMGYNMSDIIVHDEKWRSVLEYIIFHCNKVVRKTRSFWHGRKTMMSSGIVSTFSTRSRCIRMMTNRNIESYAYGFWDDNLWLIKDKVRENFLQYFCCIDQSTGHEASMKNRKRPSAHLDKIREIRRNVRTICTSGSINE